MKDIEMKQVYIRKDFAQKAKLLAATEGKNLQEVLDEIFLTGFREFRGDK